eukprot:Tbor_TRINITY_DN2526_c0_g1::TRINITY_DN2526_c0_g1_i1::g.466::m.466/K12870/ISY1; pre-mRNA-splicing factor ISY1
MQDYLAEAKGTLARTAQKKQTVISLHHALKLRAAKEKKFGFAERPDDPNVVNTMNAAEHFYKEINAEITNRVARLNNLDSGAIEREGEEFVRNINSEVNALRRERNRWAYKLEALGSSLATSERVIKDKFFGVAKSLPEARINSVENSFQSSGEKRVFRDDDDEYENDSDNFSFLGDSDGSENDDSDHDSSNDELLQNSTLRVSFDVSDSEEEENLRAAEVEAETEFRTGLIKMLVTSSSSEILQMELDKDEINAMSKGLSVYNHQCMSYTRSLPPEVNYQRDLIQRRKRQLLEKLKATK